MNRGMMLSGGAREPAGYPEILDRAVPRAGRFGRRIILVEPELEDRVAHAALALQAHNSRGERQSAGSSALSVMSRDMRWWPGLSRRAGLCEVSIISLGVVPMGNEAIEKDSSRSWRVKSRAVGQTDGWSQSARGTAVSPVAPFGERWRSIQPARHPFL